MSEDLNFSALMEELGLIEDGEQPVDLDNLPKERSALPREIPQPGTLVLRIPGGFKASKDTIGQVDSQGEKRLQVKFREENALLVQPSGIALNYNITDFRNQDKNGVVSGEMLSFVKALGHKGAFDGTKEAILRVLLGNLGSDFKADLSYTAKCNPKGEAWAGGKKMGKVGCGMPYGMKFQEYTRKDGTLFTSLEIPKNADGTRAQRFTCKRPGCGADISVFVRLSNYREA